VRYWLTQRLQVLESSFEIQRIHGEDGSVWLRLSTDGRLFRVWSAQGDSPGVVPPDEAVRVIANASTARNPVVVLDKLRLAGWELWPAVPKPISRYLDSDFDREAAAMEIGDALAG
jgi:hypothetical protein